MFVQLWHKYHRIKDSLKFDYNINHQYILLCNMYFFCRNSKKISTKKKENIKFSHDKNMKSDWMEKIYNYLYNILKSFYERNLFLELCNE